MNKAWKQFCIFLSLAPLSLCAAFDSLEQSAVLAQAVKQHYALEGTFELSPVNPLTPLAETPTAVELLDMPASPAALMIVKARYLRDKAYLGEVSGAFHAQWRVNALIAKKQLSKGSLDLADFDVQSIDRLALKQMPVDPQLDLKGYEILNSVQAGAPLTWNVLKTQPLIRKGELAEVIAEDGLLRISTKAIATQDAGRGETVIMRNPTTNRQFPAYVINENLVQIRF